MGPGLDRGSASKECRCTHSVDIQAAIHAKEGPRQGAADVGSTLTAFALGADNVNMCIW